MIFLKILLVVFLLYCCYVLIVSMLWGAPYVPSDRQTIEVMLKLVGESGERAMVDLGSGDGRVVEAFAVQGFRAVGYEINPLLVWWSRFRLWRAGLSKVAIIKSGDFWWADFSEFEVVVVFGMTHIMSKLEKKLQAELVPGALVITNYYHFSNWKLEKKVGRLGVYCKQ